VTDSSPAYGGPAPDPEYPQEQAHVRRRWNVSDWRPARRDVLAALAAMVTAAVVGVPLGWIWAHTAHRVDVQSALSDNESAFSRQTGVDLWFALLSLIAGLLVGALVWWLSRPADWPVPLGLAVGCTGGALIAGAVGRAINSGIPGLPHDATDLARDLLRFQLRAPGWYVVYPAVALIVMLIAMSIDPEQPQPAPEVAGEPPAQPVAESDANSG
jgi:F0F1-type ATP synthase assembly protein I